MFPHPGQRRDGLSRSHIDPRPFVSAQEMTQIMAPERRDMLEHAGTLEESGTGQYPLEEIPTPGNTHWRILGSGLPPRSACFHTSIKALSIRRSSSLSYSSPSNTLQTLRPVGQGFGRGTISQGSIRRWAPEEVKIIITQPRFDG